MTIGFTGGGGRTEAKFASVVLPAVPSLNGPVELRSGQFGRPYAVALPPDWAASSVCAVESGRLPPGLTISAAKCEVGGTPSARGTYDASIALAGPEGLVSLPIRIDVG